MNMKSVCVVGLGYIGLPTAALMASRKISVLGVDISERVVETINKGQVHIVEPDLMGLVSNVVSQGLLKASTKPAPSDVFIVAVPTPFLEHNHEPDLSYVSKAIESIAPHLKKGNLVIIESTCPVQTTEKMVQILSKLRPELSFPQRNSTSSCDVHVAYCPERVLPGRILTELVKNDRVIGGLSPSCAEVARKFYKLFVEGDCIATEARTAELIKLAENSFRDVNIAFANEMALVCEKSGINFWEMRNLANLHPRVNILQAGPGVGGHCIAVDPWFIISDHPNETPLLRNARKVNDGRPQYFVNKILNECKITGSNDVAILGLAFKANVDDLRESPAVQIVEALTKNAELNIFISEPNIEALPPKLQSFKNLKLVTTEEAISKSKVVALLVDHREYSEILPNQIEGKSLIDSRGVFSQINRD